MTAITCEHAFPGRPETAGQARAWVCAALDGCPPGLVDDAALAVSELVTNALRYSRSGAGGQVMVCLDAGPDGVCVHVRDQGGGPVSGGAGHGSEGGRGLHIVGAVTAAWGRAPAALCPAARPDDPYAAGTCVWFRIGAAPGPGHATTLERVLERAGWRCQCTGQCGRPHTGAGGGRCLAEHAACELHAVPAWPVSPARAAALPPAALAAMCGPCHAGNDRRVRRERAAAPAQEEALFAKETAR